MKYLLFDIDGTLIHSGGAGARALNRAFKLLHNVDDAMSVINPHGQTDIAIVEEIFLKKLGRLPQKGEVEDIFEYYLTFLKEEVVKADKYQVLKGVRETLDELKGKSGLLLGLATGNIERGARIKLERGDLNKYFPFGGFGSDHRERSQIVRIAVEKGKMLSGEDPSEVFVIGDTPLDVEAGKKAGFKTVAVATSIYSKEELEKCEPDFVFSSLLEIIDII
ncbi:MAG: HAD family hydrolase [Candidatus Hydrothermia bacterium]|jgi:HAD superfamily hydrolase (TIGR01549 family)